MDTKFQSITNSFLFLKLSESRANSLHQLIKFIERNMQLVVATTYHRNEFLDTIHQVSDEG